MDDTERLLTQTLRKAADDAPRSTGMAFPRQASRRRAHWKSSTFAAVGIALIVVSVVLMSGWVRPPSNTLNQAVLPSDPGSAGSSSGTPRPIGRVVVLGQAALPVPTGWSVNDLSCMAQPRSDTVAVILPGAAFPACGTGRAANVSDIKLWRLDDPVQADARDRARTKTALLDGTPAFIGHEQSDPPPGYVTTIVVVPELDVVAIGMSPNDEPLDDYMLRITHRDRG